MAYGYFQKNLPNAILPGNDLNPSVPVADLRISAPPIAERPRLVIFVDFGHSGLQTGRNSVQSIYLFIIFSPEMAYTHEVRV